MAVFETCHHPDDAGRIGRRRGTDAQAKSIRHVYLERTGRDDCQVQAK